MAMFCREYRKSDRCWKRLGESIPRHQATIYFQYNDVNLVTDIKYPGGVMNYFYYDAMLKRYAMKDSSGLRYFTWDANGMNLLAERDVSGTVKANYTHGYTPVNGIGSMVAATQNETATYYQYPVYDHRGTVVRLVDDSGIPTAYYEYDAWGNELHNNVVSGTGTNRFRYQSNWIELADSDGTLYLSLARVYDAKAGRFGGRDPKDALAGDFLYTDTSPITEVDGPGTTSTSPSEYQELVQKSGKYLKRYLAITKAIAKQQKTLQEYEQKLLDLKNSGSNDIERISELNAIIEGRRKGIQDTKGMQSDALNKWKEFSSAAEEKAVSDAYGGGVMGWLAASLPDWYWDAYLPNPHRARKAQCTGGHWIQTAAGIGAGLGPVLVAGFVQQSYCTAQPDILVRHAVGCIGLDLCESMRLVRWLTDKAYDPTLGKVLWKTITPLGDLIFQKSRRFAASIGLGVSVGWAKNTNTGKDLDGWSVTGGVGVGAQNMKGLGLAVGGWKGFQWDSADVAPKLTASWGGSVLVSLGVSTKEGAEPGLLVCYSLPWTKIRI